MKIGILGLLALISTGCAGTFEEARIAGVKAREAAPAAPAATLERCQRLSDAARLEGALAKGGAALTGASGIATWPVEGDARVGLAIASGVLAAGTATVLYLQDSDSSAYVAEGCGAAK